MAMVATPMTLEVAHVQGFELVERHTNRFIDFVADLDGDALREPVPGCEWTAGEVITHVQSVYLRYTSDLRRADTPGAVAVQNAEDIRRLGVDVAAATASIAEQLAVLGTVVPHVAPDQLFPF